jgi:hypothetical protein
MCSLKYQEYYSLLDWIQEEDFQVAESLHAGYSEKGKVLLVPAPWSSPCDKPIEWQENQRHRLATKLKEEWYTVLTMIPPGKPNHHLSWKESIFSFSHYAQCIEAVLYRDSFKKWVTHIITSSLWQIATILALQNDTHPNKKERKIIIWAPIDSLEKVLSEQKKFVTEWITEELIMYYYAQMHWLQLDEEKIKEEIQKSKIRTLWISQLTDTWYKNVSIYGNNKDRYYSESDNSNLKFTHFFNDYKENDPFFHGFTDKSAAESIQIVKQFLNNTYREKNPETNQDLFIKWLLSKTYIF